jgi:hypothetical protein
MPPTPTPFPISTPPPLDLDLSLWDMTDTAIQFWNSADPVTTTFQAILLFGILSFIVMMIYRYAKIISVLRNQ